MATNFCNQDLNYLENNLPQTFDDRFTVRNIRDKALAKLPKISHTQIHVSLQYLMP